MDVVQRRKRQRDEQTMNKQVLDSIVHALGRYGKSTPEIVFWNLRESQGLKEEDILRYPEKFVQSLQKMFGIGTKTIETVIIREIKSTIPELRDAGGESLVLVLKEARAQDQRNREF